MNERIRLLAKNYLMYERFSRYGESTEEEYYDFLPEELEEFVQLIVRECVERIKRVGILEDIENETDMVVDAVKEHFGVKE